MWNEPEHITQGEVARQGNSGISIWLGARQLFLKEECWEHCTTVWFNISSLFNNAMFCNVLAVRSEPKHLYVGTISAPGEKYRNLDPAPSPVPSRVLGLS